MASLKLDSTRTIPLSMFNICLIDGADKKDIIKSLPKRSDGAYYIDKFSNYLKKYHATDLPSYCEKYLNLEWPECQVKKIKLGWRPTGRGPKISSFSKGGINAENCEAFKLGCQKLGKKREGKGNPMFGKKPWNKGKKYNNFKLKGKPLSLEHRESLKKARAKSKFKARHTTPHSEKTKEKLRIRQAEKYANGIFSRKTSIEIKVEEYLSELNLEYDFIFQHQVKYFTLDFACEERKIGIECQGTFFHIDPRFYPQGPICAIQRRNLGRDKSKLKFFKKLNWTIIELWETEINNGQFKQILKTKLLELGALEL